MMRRVRSKAGLITFIVLALSLVEGAWAVMCAPGLETRATSAAAAHPASHGGEQMPGHGDGHDHPGAPDCPFSPAGAAQGCVLGASLPAEFAPGLALTPEAPDLYIAAETEPHLLLSSSLFHPPKA